MLMTASFPSLARCLLEYAFQTGGGVNIPLKGSLGWRVGEIDYILTNLPNGTNGYQGDIRISSGITFHFR